MLGIPVHVQTGLARVRSMGRSAAHRSPITALRTRNGLATVLRRFCLLTVGGIGSLLAQRSVGGRECPGTSAGRQVTDSITTLVVVVPGLDSSTDDWADAISTIRADTALRLGTRHARWYCVDHGLSVFSRDDLSGVVRGIHGSIDAAWDKQGGYREVILVAHSGGAVLVRAALLASRGRLAGEYLSPSPWSDSVRRLVMFAGLGRGVSGTRGVTGFLRRTVDRTLGLRAGGFVYQGFLRGAPFITNVRLSWILASRSDPVIASLPVTQLLGQQDDIVHFDDNDDVMTLPNAEQIAVPGADHQDILVVAGTANPAERAISIRMAFASAGSHQTPAARIAPLSTLAKSTVRQPRQQPRCWAPAADAAVPLRQEDQSIRRVVVLVHGIRSGVDSWQVPMADSLMGAAATSGEQIRVCQPAYGYFSALQFISGFERQRYVPVLLDHLAEIRWRYPAASIDVIAHSYGTYILGEALRTVPALAVNQVVLAGSPMSPTFDWDRLAFRRQVLSVTNIVASRDGIVAGLASVVRGLGNASVGAAGVTGFQGTIASHTVRVQGGHGAGVADPVMSGQIAQFLMHGTALRPPGDTATIRAQLESRRTTSRFMPGIAQAVKYSLGYAAACNITHASCLGVRNRELFNRPQQLDVGRAAIWVGSFALARYLLKVY